MNRTQLTCLLVTLALAALAAALIFSHNQRRDIDRIRAHTLTNAPPQ